LLGFPVSAALSAKAAHVSILEIFLSVAGVVFLFNLVDWLILDWLIVCTITPKFMVLPGTEGMAGYKNYATHFRGFSYWHGSRRGDWSRHNRHRCLALRSSVLR
jgi:hypothetical protein